MRHSSGYRFLTVTACIVGLATLTSPAAAQITFTDTITTPAAAPSAALRTAVVTLDPFSTIQVCAPVNVLVVPSNGTNYTVTGQADHGVLQSLVPVVANGTLQLQTSGNFTTNTIVSLQARASLCTANETAFSQFVWTETAAATPLGCVSWAGPAPGAAHWQWKIAVAHDHDALAHNALAHNQSLYSDVDIKGIHSCVASP